MKTFPGLIINMVLIWSSEWAVWCGDVQIFWTMLVGNDTTKESNQAIKRTMKVHGVIEYIETVSEIFCAR
jgi:hypothetical protein